jgi:uncharacterized protein (TIGR02246 family)
MKTTSAITLCALFLLVSACAPKVNDPADVQAIKTLVADFDAAWEADKPDSAADNYYADDAVRLEPNQPTIVGKGAIRAAFQKYGAIYTWKGTDVAEDVRVSGDLAVVRGSGSGSNTPKAGGAAISDKGHWVAAYERQTDGSWRCIFDSVSSTLPVTDQLPFSDDELALLQIEHNWADAVLKRDAAALDPILATEFISHSAETTRNKKQALAQLKSDTVKIESGQLSDMRALVFGDTAVVHGMWTEKSTTSGKDTSGQYRWTDTFVKRDGRWQCVGNYSEKIG